LRSKRSAKKFWDLSTKAKIKREVQVSDCNAAEFYIVKKGCFVRFIVLDDLAGNARVKCLTLMRRTFRLTGGSFDAHELC